MSIINTILKKEIDSYFKNYMIYIIVGIYLLLSFAATFYAAYFFEYDNRGLLSFFAYQPEIFNVLLPTLTMKMWAEEHKQGTLEFLLTQPVSRGALVLGKYLSSFLTGVFLLFLTLPFLIYSSFLIDLDWLNIISGYFACLLVVGTLCALGCLISAYNTNPILAYLASVFVGWIWQNVNFDILLTPFKVCFPLLQNRLSAFLNFTSHYQSLVQGQISLVSIGYFISLILMFLWLNLYLVQRRR